MQNKSILLIIGGGIAAYKSLELIRLLKKRGTSVRVILTKGGAEFVTPLSVATLAGEKTLMDLFDLDDESKIGHIQLARDADLVVVAPATADLMAKMAHGLANDLASTCLLAADSEILIAPAMNPVMWEAAPTKRNSKQLRADGIHFAGPSSGDMACGEEGEGRMLEPSLILAEIDKLLNQKKTDQSLNTPLAGQHVLVTAGPTHEPIDPVRYIANRSSGKQGYAIAIAARDLGADVTLISGPTRLDEPDGISVVQVQTAVQMKEAALAALPANIAICTAAVADWRTKTDAGHKIKKKGSKPPQLELVENPDILKALSKSGPQRPDLVIGFAAETQDLVENSRKKLKAKGCDWIIANDVSPQRGTFGGDKNKVLVFRGKDFEEWPLLDKEEVARRLMRAVADSISNKKLAAE
jgi:phosphopantothenoylcysteine decarboxylase / phosphopantothenate---cysteine ligase